MGCLTDGDEWICRRGNVPACDPLATMAAWCTLPMHQPQRSSISKTVPVQSPSGRPMPRCARRARCPPHGPET
ncbi:hypothetical protein FOCC_FOCC005824 [Frankliniella occidentalis]|nr:hypothetical protein FOCC_FOCC005824 [Frankliniella occidentalis]